MEENKDIKDEDIIVENEPVIEDTDNVDKAEAAEAEEIVEEYSENDDLSLIRKMKDENKKLSNEVEALKERLLRLTAEYDNYRKRNIYRCLYRCIKGNASCS